MAGYGINQPSSQRKPDRMSFTDAFKQGAGQGLGAAVGSAPGMVLQMLVNKAQGVWTGEEAAREANTAYTQQQTEASKNAQVLAEEQELRARAQEDRTATKFKREESSAAREAALGKFLYYMRNNIPQSEWDADALPFLKAYEGTGAEASQGPAAAPAAEAPAAPQSDRQRVLASVVPKAQGGAGKVTHNPADRAEAQPLPGGKFGKSWDEFNTSTPAPSSAATADNILAQMNAKPLPETGVVPLAQKTADRLRGMGDRKQQAQTQAPSQPTAAPEPAKPTVLKTSLGDFSLDQQDGVTLIRPPESYLLTPGHRKWWASAAGQDELRKMLKEQADLGLVRADTDLKRAQADLARARAVPAPAKGPGAPKASPQMTIGMGLVRDILNDPSGIKAGATAADPGVIEPNWLARNTNRVQQLGKTIAWLERNGRAEEANQLQGMLASTGFSVGTDGVVSFDKKYAQNMIDNASGVGRTLETATGLATLEGKNQANAAGAPKTAEQLKAEENRRLAAYNRLEQVLKPPVDEKGNPLPWSAPRAVQNILTIAREYPDMPEIVSLGKYLSTLKTEPTIVDVIRMLEEVRRNRDDAGPAGEPETKG